MAEDATKLKERYQHGVSSRDAVLIPPVLNAAAPGFLIVAMAFVSQPEEEEELRWVG
jgi:hypothetical protein